MNMKFALMSAVCCVAALGVTAEAAVFKVPQQYSTIQAAVNAAAEGDTVRVAAGTYFEHILIRGKAITLVGAGAGETFLDGSRSGRVVSVFEPGPGLVTVSGFTIRNGRRVEGAELDLLYTRAGGLAVMEANIAIRNNVFTGNSGCIGTAIATVASAVTMVRNRVDNNPAEPLCGQEVVMIHGSLGTTESSVIGNVIQNNNATGLYAHGAGKITISNNIFRNNIANSEFEPNMEYGGLRVWYSELTLTNNLFSGNSSYSAGGAQIVESQVSPIRIVGNSFVGNHSVIGPYALQLVGFEATDFIVQQNRFDEAIDLPVVGCGGNPFVIDRSNVFASVPAPEQMGCATE